MEKKKIVHIISSLKRGGAESLLVDLLAELTQFEHHVIYFHDGPNRQRLEAMSIKTYQVKGLLLLYDPIFFLRLWCLVKRLQPDCIHSSLWAANFAARIIAKFHHVPLVSVLHWSIFRDGTLRNIIDSFTFQLAQKVVGVSQDIAESLKGSGWIPERNVLTITNGISVHRIHALAAREQVMRSNLYLEPDVFVIGFVGRFVEIKNIPLLVNAFAEILKKNKKIALVLLGFGPLEEKLRSLVRQLNIEDKVRFVVGQAAYGYYHLFDCFVLPSFQEGMSVALLEAMCFSLPCIVTSSTRYHEVIRSDENGFVISSNDKKALVDKLVALMEDPQLRKRIGKQAFECINREFTMTTMTHKYIQLFESSLNSKSLRA